MEPETTEALIKSASSLLAGLFGSIEAKKQRKWEEAQRRKYIYRSPFIEKLDPIMMQALLQQYKRMGNWGYPEGMTMDFSFLDNLLKELQEKNITPIYSAQRPTTQFFPRSALKDYYRFSLFPLRGLGLFGR
ncbi:MAG: hypothetical protein AB1410_00120 [Acidobacteriota bacterium]